MLSVENTQSKIKNIVKVYKQEFPNEYALVCKQIHEKRRLNEDEYASTIGDHSLKRRVHEIPEKLSLSLYKLLDEKENLWFISMKGAKWFANAFPEFKSSYKI